MTGPKPHSSMHASEQFYMACKVQRDSVDDKDVDNERLASANIHQLYHNKIPYQIEDGGWEIRDLLDHSNYLFRLSKSMNTPFDKVSSTVHSYRQL